jgi:hypothetical protein
MSSRKHSPEMTAAWAADWGIRGYEQLDPKHKMKNRPSLFQGLQSRPPRLSKPNRTKQQSYK